MKCLVLGGTGYIGSELCKKLSLEGHEVFFTWHKNKVLAESLAESFESGKGFQADFRTDCKELFNTIINEMNGINALIQCAGTAGNVDIYQKRADKFQDISAKDFRLLQRNMGNRELESTLSLLAYWKADYPENFRKNCIKII